MRLASWFDPEARGWIPSLAALALCALLWGCTAGWVLAAWAVAVLLAPVLGLLLGGSALGERRGVVVACVVLAMGLAVIHPASGALAWGDVALLAVLAASALVFGRLARRLMPAVPDWELDPGPVEGQWMTVIIDCEATARPAHPPAWADRPLGASRSHPRGRGRRGARPRT